MAREDFYFIEVNSRIQVEHPVTEEITGQDLIRHQILAASGQGLQIAQDQVTLQGHALEVRINAEDPARNFQPSPGRLTAWSPPSRPEIRLDSHMRDGDLVPPFYDSMVGKLITRGKTRDDAIESMLRAIHDFKIEGITTTLPFAARIIQHPEFRENRITTRWLEDSFLPALETA